MSREFLLAVFVTAVAVGTAVVACSAGTIIKDVGAGAQLVECIDEGIASGTSVEQIIAKCGPDAAPLIEARRELARKRAACTTIAPPDGGAPTGPGR